MTTDPGERRDLADERESEEYQAMLETVREEFELRYEPFKPDSIAVHSEAMRRLKAKCENACSK